MKKYLAPIFILIAAICLAISAHAQGSGATGTQTQTMVETPQTKLKPASASKVFSNALMRLKVSDEKRAKLKVLVKAQEKNLIELKKSVKSGATTKEAAKTKRQEWHRAMMQSIKAILTPAQTVQFAALLKEEAKKARATASTSTGLKIGGR